MLSVGHNGLCVEKYRDVKQVIKCERLSVYNNNKILSQPCSLKLNDSKLLEVYRKGRMHLLHKRARESPQFCLFGGVLQHGLQIEKWIKMLLYTA